MTIARRFLYDSADAVRLDALAGGSWAPLAELVGKLVREERYHRMHAEAWLDAPGADATASRASGCWPRSRARPPMPRRCSRHSPTNRRSSTAGILDAPMAELEARWRASIAPLLAASGLPMPPPARDPMRGRLDHGEPFRWLWGEFTSVRRADPGATW